MVTVHREAGLRFVIHKDDHLPAHVHVIGDGVAKFDLSGRDGKPKLVKMQGMNAADLRRALRIIVGRQDELLAHWRSIHG